MIERARGAAASLVGTVVLLALSGCAFHHTVINAGVRDLDPSGIVVGETDHLGVMKQLGLPPPDVPEEAGIRAVSRDYLVYSTAESRCFRIGFEQVLVITPFRWCFREYTYDLAVEFDASGIVSGVYETQRGLVWRPFQGEDDRAPPATRGLVGTPLP